MRLHYIILFLRWGERIWEPVGIDVGFEMVDGIERFVPENGKHACGKGANEERTKQTGGVSNGDIINIVMGEVGVVQGLMDDGEDSFEVGAGGDFRNDAAVGSENVNLGNDDVAEDAGSGDKRFRGGRRRAAGKIVADDGSGGFVARTFDGEDFHNAYYIIELRSRNNCVPSEEISNDISSLGFLIISYF